MRITSLLNSKGMSLIEAVVSIGILGIITLSMVTILDVIAQSNKRHEALMARDEIHRIAVQSVKTSSGLAYTCANNPEFASCFNFGAAACLGGVTTEFNLFDNTGNRIAGTAADPVYYNKNGNPCTLADSSCVYQVRSEYRAQGYPEDCGGNCTMLLPRPRPLAGFQHEFITIELIITPIDGRFELPVGERKSSTTFPIYRKFPTGCPTI